MTSHSTAIISPSSAKFFVPAPLLARLAAMIYEAVLLFGVLFLVGIALLPLAGWTHPLELYQRNVLFAAWVLAMGLYFCSQWVRGGQTLPMKSWDLRLVNADGTAINWKTALARYVLAWHLLLPGIAAIALVSRAPVFALTALGASPLLMLLTALLDPQRQLLHDRLLGTRVIRSVSRGR